MISKRQTRLLPFGASLYWVACLLGLGKLTGVQYPNFLPVVWISTLTATLVVTIIFFWGKKLEPKKVLYVLNRSAVFLSLFCFAFALVYQFFLRDSLIMYISRQATLGLTMGILMQVWSLHFCIIDTQKSVSIICATVIWTVALFLIALVLPQQLVSVLSPLLLLFSSVYSLIMGSDFVVKVSATTPPAYSKSWSYWMARVLYGLGIGAVVGLTGYSSTIAEFPVASLVVSGIVGISLFLSESILLPVKNRFLSNIYWLPAVPLLVVALLGVLLIGSNVTFLRSFMVISSWFCFMILSSAQISKFRVDYKMKATQIAFGEKAVVMGFWLIGSIFIATLFPLILSSGIPLELLLGIFSGILIISTVISLTRHAMILHTQKQGEDTSIALKDVIAIRCEALADRNGLTPREKEILILLASGKSGASITSELVISKGTFKTHSYRIYQKLGIHKNTEIIDLVNSVPEVANN